MSIVVPDEGKQNIMAILFVDDGYSASTRNYTAHLFNQTVMSVDASTTLSELQAAECSFSGYVPIVLNYPPTDQGINGSDEDVQSWLPVSWTCATTAGTDTAWGYWIDCLGLTGTYLLWCELFPTPTPMYTYTDFVGFTPQLFAGQI